MEANERLKNLLERKLTIMSEFLRLTSELNLTGEPERFMAEAEAYTNLIDKRERFIAEMKQIDNEIDSSEFKTNGSFKPEYADEAGRIILLIKSAAGEIISKEKEINKALPMIHDRLKKGIREINEGKSLNHLYYAQVEAGGSSLYDKKK